MADLFPDTIESPQEIIDRAIGEHDPVAIYAMFSGGYDSLVNTHLCASYLGPRLTGVAHINTGIGIEETRKFVRRTCTDYGWPLIEKRAVDEGKMYADIVVKHGFPGPYAHRMMYTSLKERALRSLIRESKRKSHDRVMLLSGARREESERRMSTTVEIMRSGAQVWVNPCFYWTKRDTNAYRIKNRLPRNEVADLLHMSGECLCGAFARPGELAEISRWYPETGERIRSIERRVRAAGHAWGWEEQPPDRSKVPETQHDLITPPMCVGCAKR